MKPILKKLKKISCVSSNQFATGKRRRKKFERRIFSLTYILRQGGRNMRWNFKNFSPLLIYSRKDPKSDKKIWSAQKNSSHLYNRVRKKKFNEIIKKVEKSKAGKNIKAVFRLSILWFCRNRTWCIIFAKRCNGMEEKLKPLHFVPVLL